MIMVDTSAWVEYTRDTGSAVCRELQALSGEELAICDVVRMELLAGARSEHELDSLIRVLDRAVNLPMRPEDYEDAAALYRLCRRHGETVRSLIDCVVGALAVRIGVPILHQNGDFHTLARHTPVESYVLTNP